MLVLSNGKSNSNTNSPYYKHYLLTKKSLLMSNVIKMVMSNLIVKMSTFFCLFNIFISIRSNNEKKYVYGCD